MDFSVYKHFKPLLNTGSMLLHYNILMYSIEKWVVAFSLSCMIMRACWDEASP